MTEDEGIRPGTTAESLAKLKPAFAQDGTITAGTASQISDGAAAVVVMSAEAARRAGADVLAEIGAHGNVAGPDNSLHSQPSHAIKQALAKAGLTVADLDLIEINEAFAVVAIQSMRDLGVGPRHGERQRRRDRDRPPDRGLRRQDRPAPVLRAAPARRRARRRRPVRRRRPGRGAAAARPRPPSPCSGSPTRESELDRACAVTSAPWPGCSRWSRTRHRTVRSVIKDLLPLTGPARVIGLTGAPGVGKSTMTAALVGAFRAAGRRVAVLAVDPTSPFTGGALLGDRIRMQDHATDDQVFIRSMATRGHLGGLAAATPQAIRVLDAAGFELILVETVGVGQAEVAIAALADSVVVLLAPGMGDAIQAAKAGILEVADLFVVNKADKPDAHQVVRDLRTMLALGHHEPGGWKPPVITAVATGGLRDAGIVELGTRWTRTGPGSAPAGSWSSGGARGPARRSPRWPWPRCAPGWTRAASTSWPPESRPGPWTPSRPPKNCSPRQDALDPTKGARMKYGYTRG